MPPPKNPDEPLDDNPEDQQKLKAGDTPEGSDAGKKQDPEKPEVDEPVKYHIPALSNDDLSIEDIQFRTNRLVGSLGQSESERSESQKRIEALEAQIAAPAVADDADKNAGYLLSPEEMDQISDESAKKTARILWDAQNRKEAGERLKKGMQTEDEEMTEFVKDLAKSCGRKRLPEKVLNPEGIEDVFKSLPPGQRGKVMKQMIRDAAAQEGLVRLTPEQLAAAEGKVKGKLKANLPDGGSGPVEEPKEFEDVLAKMRGALNE